MVTHLFLLVPPRGGSHLLEHVLATSPTVSTMPLEEGEKYFCDIPTYLNAWAPVSCVHGFASRKINYYDDDNKYNWYRIRKVWNEAWNKEAGDKQIFLEKSPPNIFRYNLLDRHFENALFIGMIRHPYAQIEAWCRHFGGGNMSSEALHDYYVDWIRHAEYLIKAKRELGDRLLIINYEELTGRFEEVARRLTTFIPLLHKIEKPYEIRNKNVDSLKRFNYKEINDINDAALDRTMFTMERIKVERSMSALNYFNYSLLVEEKQCEASTDEFLFWTGRFLPLIPNEKYVSYYNLDNDGGISHMVPSWMEYFNFVCREYKMLFYEKEKLLC